MSNTKSSSPISEDSFSGGGVKYTLSKFEYDLYLEESDIQMPIIRVKHFKLPNNGEKWKIYSDEKVVFVLEGSKLLKKERQFLHGLGGINFLINERKKGIKSLNALKLALKEKIKQTFDAKNK